MPPSGEEQRRQLYADVLDHLRNSKPQPVMLMREVMYSNFVN